LQLSSAVTIEKMHSALILDKKSLRGAPRFVLLEKIGACSPFADEYCSEVSHEILEEALAWMIALFSGDEQ
jgi:3-dehydroquinate synthetase